MIFVLNLIETVFIQNYNLLGYIMLYMFMKL